MRFSVGDLIKVCQSVRRSIRLIHTNIQSENEKKKKKKCLIYISEKSSINNVVGILMNLLAQKKQLINTTTLVLQRATEKYKTHMVARVFRLKKIPKQTNEKTPKQSNKTQTTQESDYFSIFYRVPRVI